MNHEIKLLKCCLLLILLASGFLFLSCKKENGKSQDNNSRPSAQSEVQSQQEPAETGKDVDPESGSTTLAVLPPELPELAILKPWKGDFDGMKDRRVIRALVVYSKTMYFIDGAQERGITYEALKEFEKSINEKLKTGHIKMHVIFIPVSRDELLPSLVNGLGDMTAANLTVTSERSESVDFSDPVFRNVSEIIVTGPNAPEIRSIEDLAGNEVYIRKSSSYYESLQQLNDSFQKNGKKQISIVPVSEYLESEDILEMVNAGLYPITIVDSHLGEFWSQVFDKITAHKDMAIKKEGKIAWAFRKNSPQFAAEINEFIQTHGQGTLFGNVLLKKYLKNVDWIKNNVTSTERKKFENTVHLFRKYSDQYDFDYLLVAAQGYQESKLDQSLKSRAGALGVMQLLPTTAADPQVNIPDISKTENNIHAGVKYMRFMIDHYFKNEPMDSLNKQLFAFASYNAGPGKISRLRKQAKSMGLNPNVWFRNVELVAAKEIGQETVQYVSNIYKYYLAYIQIHAIQEKREEAKSKTGK